MDRLAHVDSIRNESRQYPQIEPSPSGRTWQDPENAIVK